MDKFVNGKNFLIKYLILELFEKLYRLKKYINTCGKFDKKNNNDKIIKLFNSSIEVIGNEIGDLCTDVNSDLTDDEKFAYVLKISQNSRAIIKIHEELKNLHPSWTLPEIKTFANEIINKNFSGRNEVNIILSDNYTFLERNLGKKFEATLTTVYSNTGLAESIKDNHTFILPKIEFSNPLNWTIIVHEAGHLNKESIDKLRDDKEILPDEIHSSNESVIKNWAEEIYCDIYATSLLGPAYFISFISFALLSTMDYGISSFSEMHPSVIVRASIMIAYLKKNNLVFNSSWGLEDYAKIFYDNLLMQNELFKEKDANTIQGLTKFNRNLRKAIKDLKLGSFGIDETDAKRVKLLLFNLNRGIPIGSVYLERELNWDDAIEKKEISTEEITKLKIMVSERSCKIWEILNTGWIYKLETNCKIG